MGNVAAASQQTNYNLEISQNVTGLQDLRRIYRTAEAKRRLILNADNIGKLGLYVNAFGPFYIFDLLSSQELIKILEILPRSVLNTWDQKMSMTRRINNCINTKSWDEVRNLLNAYFNSDFFRGNAAFCKDFFGEGMLWVRFGKRIKINLGDKK